MVFDTLTRNVLNQHAWPWGICNSNHAVRASLYPHVTNFPIHVPSYFQGLLYGENERNRNLFFQFRFDAWKHRILVDLKWAKQECYKTKIKDTQIVCRERTCQLATINFPRRCARRMQSVTVSPSQAKLTDENPAGFILRRKKRRCSQITLAILG